MAKYRKKPVVIDAFQWFEHLGEVGGVYAIPECGQLVYYIDTLEGTLEVSEGNYIVTGIKGERYPVRQDIFEQTYEKEKENA